jgi:hypothetical protein
MVAVLLLSGCSSGRACPMYVAASGIHVDATAYATAHPDAAEVCVGHGNCQPIDRAFLPVDGPGTTRLDVAVTTAGGAVLLQATPSVKVRHVKTVRGCSNATDTATVTIAADGSITSR